LKEAVKIRKKLIEVALPLAVINASSVRESYIYRGNPSAIHKWWAQRPLAAARAVLFAQLVDDPSSHPDLFRTEKAQQTERLRLFKIIEDLILWENTTNQQVIDKARSEIWQSWRSTCADNADHPRAKEMFDRHKLPPFLDPFAGGGTIPLEAQRLGLESYASDLNPVAVLINKALIQIPPKFAGHEPMNPEWRRQVAQQKAMQGWKGAQGLAEDVRYYGKWIQEEAAKRIGNLYPTLRLTELDVRDRPDLMKYVGKDLKVLAWLWARTVKSPNPAYSNVYVPLATTFMLSTRVGKETYVNPVVSENGYRFEVRVGKPVNADVVTKGTKIARGANFRCLLSDVPISGDYIKEEGRAGRMSARLLAVVAEGDQGRIYLSPDLKSETAAAAARPTWKPETPLAPDLRALWTPPYGLTTFGDLFTTRQLEALTTFSDLVTEARDLVFRDATAGGSDHHHPSEGSFASVYSEAVALLLAFSISKYSDYNCSLVPWYTKEDRPGHLFSKQAIPMVWDFVELNPFADIGGAFFASVEIVAGSLEGLPDNVSAGHAKQEDAVTRHDNCCYVISTDPPYYDNIGYADLSDFFYVWLRRSLRSIYPDLLATISVPKAQELVATPYRHGGKAAAERFFVDGMTAAMKGVAQKTHPAIPVTIYYAFKQSEGQTDTGTASTGWETFLQSVINAGFAIMGTWPMRTERGSRTIGIGTNSLASSIVLVCRHASKDSKMATRRNFLSELKEELPIALTNLQKGNIAPVDLAQAAIGPGMAVYTRYSKVIDAEGEPMTVRQALAVINNVLDEVLAEQEGDFDADTRWALTWFDQFGFAEGEYGVAETLANARNTSVDGMRSAGILASKSGKVRLLKSDELPKDWDPATDERLTAWETVHHLVRAVAVGEAHAAELTAKLGPKAEIGRELAYRLYNICERRKRPQEALAYNGLVQSWPEILRLARQTATSGPTQTQSALFTETV
jgi:putative DNA methylase